MTREVRPSANYDVIVVGAGIVGLAHAFAAARAGSRVLVLERDLRASNASIRNFGLVCVTGQAAGAMHALAHCSRAIWSEIATAAGLNIPKLAFLFWHAGRKRRMCSRPLWQRTAQRVASCSRAVNFLTGSRTPAI